MVSSNTPIVWELGHLGVECWHVISYSVIDSMPSSCGIFVYSDVASAVTKIAFSGRRGRDSRSCRKCLLSWMYDGSISIRGGMKW